MFVAVRASRYGHSTHGGYFDGRNRWIESHKVDIDGNAVETLPISVWDQVQDFGESLFAAPSFQEHAAMCRQMDILRGQRGPHPLPPKMGAEPMRLPSYAMPPQGMGYAPPRGMMQRGMAPPPDFQMPNRAGGMGNAPQYARSHTMEAPMEAPMRQRPAMHRASTMDPRMAYDMPREVRSQPARRPSPPEEDEEVDMHALRQRRRRDARLDPDMAGPDETLTQSRGPPRNGGAGTPRRVHFEEDQVEDQPKASSSRSKSSSSSRKKSSCLSFF